MRQRGKRQSGLVPEIEIAKLTEPYPASRPQGISGNVVPTLVRKRMAIDLKLQKKPRSQTAGNV